MEIWTHLHLPITKPVKADVSYPKLSQHNIGAYANIKGIFARKTAGVCTRSSECSSCDFYRIAGQLNLFLIQRKSNNDFWKVAGSS